MLLAASRSRLSTIRVLNDLMAYPDDTREAEMLIAVLKDGQMIRIETGATLVD